MKLGGSIMALISAASLLAGCSTTRVLSADEYRLAKNEIRVTNDGHFNTSLIRPYIKQQPNSYIAFGWNPFLSVYNWSGQDGDKGMGTFFRKIGVAPVIYEADQVETSAANIERHLEYLGYYNSKVESKVSVKKKKVYVDYAVTLGKRHMISKIIFSVPSGGTFATDFYADTSNVTIKPGTFLSEALLEKESERSAEHLRNKGYYGFTKNYYFFQADTLANPDSVVLEMRINRYTRNESPNNSRPLSRFYFNDVSISHSKNLKFHKNVLTNLNTIIPGQMYNERNVNTTYSRLSSLRAFSNVNISLTQVDTNLVDCAINLSQSPIQGFKTNLQGSSNSTGLIGISPQLSFFNRNIFRGGEWLNLSFIGNFQFKPNSKTRSNEVGTSLGLSFPRFLGLPYRFFKGPSIPRTEINASYNFQDRPEYTRNIISTSFGYNGNSHNRIFYQAYPVQVNIIRLFNLDPTFFKTLSSNPFMRNAYQNHFDIGSGFTLFYTTNSDVNPSSSYHYYKLQVDMSGNLLSLFNPYFAKDSTGSGTIWNTPYAQYVRAELNVGKTVRFGKDGKYAVAMRFIGGAGYAYGNSSVIPFEKQFYCGGANGLRGWQARAVGPGLSAKDTTFSIPSQTGDMKLEANLEYRFPLFWKLSGAVFADAGNVWTLQGQNDESRFRLNLNDLKASIAADCGLGVRMDLNFILLRVDMGFKVHDPSREQKWRSPDEWLKSDGFSVHFGVGYPF